MSKDVFNIQQKRIINFLILNNDRNGYTAGELFDELYLNRQTDCIHKDLKELIEEGIIYSIKKKDSDDMLFTYYLIVNTNIPMAKRIKHVKYQNEYKEEGRN